MRSSDWSSDVCSSDLGIAQGRSRRDRRLVAAGDRGAVRPRLSFEARRHDLRAGVRGLGGAQPRVHCSPAKAGVQNPKRRSEEHTSELQSLMRISYAVFCLKKKNPDPQSQNVRLILLTKKN